MSESGTAPEATAVRPVNEAALPSTMDGGGNADLSAVARSWLQAVVHTNFVPGGRGRARVTLERLVYRLAAALTGEPFDATPGYRVGAALVAANISAPDALGRSLTVLGQELLPALRTAGRHTISDEHAAARLATLLGHLATGFTEALRNVALTAAEDINRAERTAWRDKHYALHRRLQHALLHDPLTGLPNRPRLTQWLGDLLAVAAPGERLGICLLNLDRFKAVTNSLGPDRADQLLLAVADRLRALAGRHGYYLAHLGGDQFALVVEATACADDVAKAADQALRALPDPFRVGGHQVPLSAKAGIVERPALGADPIELLRAAHITLGWAKADRRARWAIFDPQRNATEVDRHTLTAAMPAALDGGQFTLVYQPLIRLADHAMVGVEALARWHHPTLGVLSPARFIALAEQTGLIERLGLQLLRRACAQAAAWQHLTPNPPLVSVNLSVAQIHRPGLAAIVAALLDYTGLPPDRLQLEVIESAIIRTGDGALDTLRALADLGVRLAVDDFGTGYSSLAYLSELPVHNVKLAAGFLRGLHTVPAPRRSNSTILPALISLCHDLGLSVTAEGIETAAQAEHLTALGCDLGQGFHLGRPTTPADLFPQCAGT